MVEIFLRHYKPVPERLRPEDRMVAHTGFLVFARTFAQLDTPETQEPQALPQEDMTQEPLPED